MAASQHGWVVEVLHDILQYTKKFGLEALHENCQLAYNAAVLEIGGEPRVSVLATMQQNFLDSLQELIDYSDKVGLIEVRQYLRIALASVETNLDHPALAATIIRFPVREKT